MFRSVLLSTSFCLLAVPLLTGCGGGDGKAKVSGTVSYKGSPVKAGMINFMAAENGVTVGGAAITDGKFEIPTPPGIAPGKYKVSVTATETSGEDPKAGGAPGDSSVVKVKETIPDKYNTKTELTADVESGKPNALNFDLK